MRWIWLLAAGCATTTTPTAPTDAADTGASATDTAPATRSVAYEDVGTACVESHGDATTILVDFGDCLFCTTDVALSCDATLDGTRIEVHADGSLLLVDDCGSSATCAPTTVQCAGPSVPAGTYTLAYAGVEAPVTLPATTGWTCTE